jgi:hypothetical protein
MEVSLYFFGEIWVNEVILTLLYSYDIYKKDEEKHLLDLIIANGLYS